jgi:nitrite reductase (NADH) small subunit
MSKWVKVVDVEKAPLSKGLCFKYEDEQIAVYNLNKQEWYATQNLCPHQQQMVLARGLLGDSKGEPKVSCPLHKNAFSLQTGRCLDSDKDWTLKTYPVKIEAGSVFIEV